MLDLNKLLVLANALDISLDALCGRADHIIEPSPETAISVKKQKHLLPLLCGLLAGFFIADAAVGIWLQFQNNDTQVEQPEMTSDAITQSILAGDLSVTGVGFHGKSEQRVAYQFTPNISGENIAYQITFTDSSGVSSTFDAA